MQQFHVSCYCQARQVDLHQRRPQTPKTQAVFAVRIQKLEGDCSHLLAAKQESLPNHHLQPQPKPPGITRLFREAQSGPFRATQSSPPHLCWGCRRYELRTREGRGTFASPRFELPKLQAKHERTQQPPVIVLCSCSDHRR